MVIVLQVALDFCNSCMHGAFGWYKDAGKNGKLKYRLGLFGLMGWLGDYGRP